MIAIDQDPQANPVKVISQAGQAVVLARPLKDHSMAVGLFNRGEQPAEISVSWSALNLKTKTPKVRDLWKHQDVGTSGDHITTTVPMHGVVLLKVAAK